MEKGFLTIMVEINENDSNLIIFIKLLIVILTVITVCFSTISQGIDLLNFRFRKQPRMGFTKKD
jgi:hypothetical protein